jgi:hypothetical protein
MNISQLQLRSKKFDDDDDNNNNNNNNNKQLLVKECALRQERSGNPSEGH